MKARGFSDTELLADTELRPSDLDDPYRLLSEQQARLFYCNAVRLAECCGTGLEIGWTTPLSDKGSLGMLQTAARTGRDALKEGYATRFTYNLLLGWEIEFRDGIWINRYSSQEEEEDLRIFLLERAFGMTQASLEELVGSDAKPIKVMLDYRAPENFKRYKEIFRCPVYFDQQVCEAHYSESYLDRKIESFNPEAHDVLEVLQSSLDKKLSTGKDIVNEVKMALRRKPGEFPGLEQVANNLAMSPRTLRRKLGAEDVRFQDLLDAERRKVAKDFLAHSTLTIQQIAEQCAFSDAQNFSQAFKRWTGMSPTDYRNSHSE